MKKNIPLDVANRLINPGPVVLVTCQNKGKPNVMTVAWQTPLSIRPVLVGVSIAPGRYSHYLIAESREFVVNVPPRDLYRQVHGCGTVSGRDADKFVVFGLTPIPGSRVSAPLIEECIGHLECVVVNTFIVGDHTLFVGEVLSASVEEGAFEEVWKVDLPSAKTLHHLGGDFYTYPDALMVAGS
jgi:flavin reductase (DIM6/NTAB) family NADH-FMN oxidoreductase RutF